MESMYGGRPGASFVLRASFKSVNEMITAFKRGNDYTDVWYGDYCIIDCDNKNDKTNGIIYRRGMDYNNDIGGAERIGQVVGPSSGTPYFQLASLQSIKDLAQAAQGNDYTSYKRYPTGLNADGTYKTNTDSGENGKNIFIDEYGDSETEKYSLVPGKYEENGVTKYRDTIKYSWLNLRLDNADADSWFYVGFEIPYMVTDYSIHMTSPYGIDGNTLTDATDINRIDNGDHPFYEHWDLGIPKGIKGDTIRNLRVMVPTAADIIYPISALSIDPTNSAATIKKDAAQYEGKADDIAANRQILVFDYYIYDNKMNPQPYTFYIGDFNIITKITTLDDGTVEIEYSHNNKDTFYQRIKWLDQIQLTNGNGKDGGQFTFTYNVNAKNGEEADAKGKKINTFNVSWIKGIEIEENGHIVYTYAGTPDRLPTNANKIEEGRYRVSDFIQWINSVNLNPDTGKFVVTSNQLDANKKNKVIYETQLDWIDRAYINEETGKIGFHHVYEANNTYDMLLADGSTVRVELITGATLTLVTGASISDDGIITFQTNTGAAYVVRQGNAPFHLKYIKNVTLNTDITADQRIQVTYNYNGTDSVTQPIGDPINYIQDMIVRKSDWHLLVLFKDPNHRYQPTEDWVLSEHDNQDKNGVRWYDRVVGSDGVTTAAGIYWRDYGAIKDQSGVLIGLNVTQADINASEQNTILGYLNEYYNKGLTGFDPFTGQPINGKVVTYSTDMQSDDKEFYAYDYNKHVWYFLGRLADTGVRDAGLLANNNGSEIAKRMENISIDGILLTTSSVEPAEQLPRWWEPTYRGFTS